jgi:hypothetical protein
VDGRGAGGDEVGAEVDEALGDGDRGRGDEGVEGLFGGLGLGLGGGAHAPDHGCGDAWIAEEERAAEELDHAGDGALGVRRDGGDEGGGAAAPLGGGERRVEQIVHLLADLRHHGGEEAARDGDVAPHEVLAVGEEAVPRARDGVGEEIEVAAVRGGAGDVAEEAEAARIALLRAAGDLAGAALQHAGGEAALGERACGGGADPRAREVAARREGEREGVGGDVGPPREVDAHGDAGAGAAACEGARRGGGHARGDGDEGARVALEELREHAAPEIAALGSEREGRRELVQADARGLGREEIEVVEEAVLARCDHRMEEALRVEAVERTGRVRLRGERELREALAEDRLPHAPIAPRREVDEPGGDVRARCHLGPRGGGAFRDIADGARNLAGPGAPYEEGAPPHAAKEPHRNGWGHRTCRPMGPRAIPRGMSETGSVRARLDAVSRGFRSRYLRYDELCAQVAAWAEAFPDVVRLTSLGQSDEGRDLWLLTLGKDPDRVRPAAWVDGNMHASELAGSSAALAIAEDVIHLMADPEAVVHDVPPHLLSLLRDDVLFYVLPRMCPDGAEHMLGVASYVRSNPRDRRHGKTAPYWRGADVDGDGRARLMRVEDAAGQFAAVPGEPSLLMPRLLEDPGPYYSLYPEGFIENWDGSSIPGYSFLADNAVDMNRNFPFGWAPEPRQEGAGAFGTSEAESRAVTTFAVAHPNIFAWLNLHTYGGCYIRPNQAMTDRKMNPHDLWVFEQIAAWMTPITGYPVVSGFEEFTYEPDTPSAATSRRSRTSTGAPSRWCASSGTSGSRWGSRRCGRSSATTPSGRARSCSRCWSGTASTTRGAPRSPGNPSITRSSAASRSAATTR